MSVSLKKIESNRRNALKSTGPKSPQGKAVVRMNAFRHGLTAQTVVVPFLEKPEEWEAHRKAVIISLAPVGYIERTLVERIALLMWRMKRAARYERESVAVEQEEIKGEYFRYVSQYNSLEQIEQALTFYRGMVGVVEEFPNWKAEDTLPPQTAAVIVSEVAERAGVEIEDLTIPGLPDEMELESFEGWTVGLVREAIAVVAKRCGESIEEMLRSMQSFYSYEETRAELKLRQSEIEIDRKRRKNLLPTADRLDKLIRYESHIERGLYKALHELERLQRQRAGQLVLPPVAVDVVVES